MSDDAADIHAAFAEPVTYTGAGLDGDTIMAIRSDETADPFQGAGATLRRISYEIRQEDLPQRPRKGNAIVDATGKWRVNDIVRRDDIEAWILTVEVAS